MAFLLLIGLFVFVVGTTRYSGFFCFPASGHALGCNGSGVALIPYLWGDPWLLPLMSVWYRRMDRWGNQQD
jgi:hypothetical protein